MPSYILGMNAKIYQGTTGAVLGALTEMDNVKNVTLNLTAGEADITTRANSGWRATAPTLREATVDFDMLWQPGDTGFDAIKTAFLTNDTIELAVLDQDSGTSGAQGPKGSFAVTSFTRNEQLEDALTVSVSAKLSTFDEWVEV